MVADDLDAGGLGGLGDGAGAVLVLGDDVDALADEALGRLGLLGRITPVGGVDRDDLGRRGSPTGRPSVKALMLEIVCGIGKA